MKKIILLLSALTAATVAIAQTAVVLFVLISTACAAGLALYVIDKAANQVRMEWVILESKNGQGWKPIETNRVPVAPAKMEAFPSFFIVGYTNGTQVIPHLYRVRLAEEWEIPTGYVPQLIPGAEVQPVLYAEQGTNFYIITEQP